MKVDLNINDGEFIAHYENVAKIIVERRTGKDGTIHAVETIEDDEIVYGVE